MIISRARQRRLPKLVLFLGAITAIASGCGGTTTTPSQNDLRGFGDLQLATSVCEFQNPDCEGGAPNPDDICRVGGCGPIGGFGLSSAERTTLATKLQAQFDVVEDAAPNLIGVPKVGTGTQHLLAYRLANGFSAPDSLTATGVNGEFTLMQSAQYSAELERLAPSGADDQWVGYVATSLEDTLRHDVVAKLGTEGLGLVESAQAFVSSGSRELPEDRLADPVLCQDNDVNEKVRAALSEGGIEGIDVELVETMEHSTTCLASMTEGVVIESAAAEEGMLEGVEDAEAVETANYYQVKSVRDLPVNTMTLAGPATASLTQGASFEAGIELGTVRASSVTALVVGGEEGAGDPIVVEEEKSEEPQPDVVPIALAAAAPEGLSVALERTSIDAPLDLQQATSALTITADTIAPGTYDVTVTASVDETVVRRAVLAVTVTAPIVAVVSGGATAAATSAAPAAITPAAPTPAAAPAPNRFKAGFVGGPRSFVATVLSGDGLKQGVYTSGPATMFGTLMIPVPRGSARARAGQRYFVATVRARSKRAGTTTLNWTVTPRGVQQLRSRTRSFTMPARLAVLVESSDGKRRFIERTVQVSLPALRG